MKVKANRVYTRMKARLKVEGTVALRVKRVSKNIKSEGEREG